MTVLLYPNRIKDTGFSVTRKAAALLLGFGAKVLLVDDLQAELGAMNVCFLPEPEAISAADIVVTVGGDGTMLKAGKVCIRRNKPILGINLGRIGFLATCEVEEMSRKLQMLVEGRYQIDSRILLQATAPAKNWKSVAINDITLFGRERLHPMDYSVFCDDVFVGKYRADGFIVSTPTGSTAYSLSAGGPILDHQASVMVMTPVCAHSLHAAPLVFSASRRLTLLADPDNRDDIIVNTDSANQCCLHPGEKLTIQTAEYHLKLISFDAAEQFNAIETKLTRR